MRPIAESDWKLFRKLLVVAHERYCERALNEIEKISSDRSTYVCERFELAAREFARHLKEFRELGDVRRSTALIQTARLHHLGLLTDDEVSDFSQETRDFVLFR